MEKNTNKYKQSITVPLYKSLSLPPILNNAHKCKRVRLAYVMSLTQYRYT